jgi:sterol desaturase/sphingolipid hydroxylase (fatty acid hydroxylase superfamily)
MQALVDYFSNIPTSHRTALLLGGMVFFWMIEGLVPLMRMRYQKFTHALPNLFFTVTTAIVNLGFAFLILSAANNPYGLLSHVDLHWAVELIIGLLILDLIGAYLVHWVEHQVPWMWKFHVIHHSDTKVDATTALRHHPGESIFRAFFTVIAVALTGAPVWMVLLYQSLSALMSQFNHANLNLGKNVDRLLSYVICTPGMHRVHHHAEQPLTDMNYGNLFSFWDRVFGTFTRASAESLTLGLDVFDKREGHLGDLLKLPFDGKSYTTKD